MANKKLNELVGNTAIFMGVYFLLAALTYILPYYEFAGNVASGLNDMAASMNQAVNEINQMSGAKSQVNFQKLDTSGGTFPFVLHLIALSGIVFITYVKAQQIEKSWIVILPSLAFAFDVLPLISLIPLVPTGLHLATIIITAKGKDKVVYAPAPEKEEPKEEEE